MKNTKLKFTTAFLFVIITSLLYANINDLIFKVEQDYYKTKFNFKLKGGKKFKLSFASVTHEGKKEYNQKIYLESAIHQGDHILNMISPLLILNSDSAKNSYIINTVTDSEFYELTAMGRASIYTGHIAPEKTKGFTLDNSPDKKFCDFSFFCKEDTTLKCTIHLENVE